MIAAVANKPLCVLTHDDATDYHRVIYNELTGLVIESGLNQIQGWNPDNLDGILANIDVFHLHWPEWLLAADMDLHQRFAVALQRAKVSIVWTQHNLIPHRPNSAWAGIYRFWAERADGVIHHSRWGMARALTVQPYRQDCKHLVVHHPHFGTFVEPQETRVAIETRLGWRSDVLRLTIVGSPRPGKRVGDAITAFSQSDRSDIELRVFSLDAGEAAQEDSRIFAEPYARVSRATYDQRLAVSDALLMPFHQTPMLTTGTVADAVAHGLPCLTSDWPFLTEILGDARIVYGSRPDALTASLDRLDRAELKYASAAAIALQQPCNPAFVATRIHDFLREVNLRQDMKCLRSSPTRPL